MIPLMMQQDYKPQGWRKLEYYHQDLGLFSHHHRYATNTGSFCS